MSVSSSSSFSSPTGAQHPRGLAFSDALMREVRERFLLVERDHHGRERLYFDNAGGSFRLKAAIERFAAIDAVPDNTERIHETALELQACLLYTSPSPRDS